MGGSCARIAGATALFSTILNSGYANRFNELFAALGASPASAGTGNQSLTMFLGSFASREQIDG
jgi:hypothetical protein